jgi:(p)ppGpp synthase/HD superfamily hydrolase
MITKSEPWYVATLDLVKQRHNGKQDKMGRPYYQHFERVADRLLQGVPNATRAQTLAALLHDALEPGEMTLEELRGSGIDDEVIVLIQLITLPTDGRSYLQYIADLAATRNIAAIQVKLADNADAIANHEADGSPQAKQTLEETYLPSRKMMLQALS